MQWFSSSSLFLFTTHCTQLNKIFFSRSVVQWRRRPLILHFQTKIEIFFEKWYFWLRLVLGIQTRMLMEKFSLWPLSSFYRCRCLASADYWNILYYHLNVSKTDFPASEDTLFLLDLILIEKISWIQRRSIVNMEMLGDTALDTLISGLTNQCTSENFNQACRWFLSHPEAHPCLFAGVAVVIMGLAVYDSIQIGEQNYKLFLERIESIRKMRNKDDQKAQYDLLQVMYSYYRSIVQFLGIGNKNRDEFFKNSSKKLHQMRGFSRRL